MINRQDKHYVLAIAILTSFTGALTLNAVNVALPAMATELSLNAVQLGWAAQAFTLASSIFIIPFGSLADIWGRKKIFTIGLIITVLSTLLLALSTFFIMFISFRVLQGLGTSMIYSTGVALLISAYPINERGKILGINVAAVSLGLSLGPSVGGILTQNLGWRSIFFLFLILLIPVLVILLTKIKGEWLDAKGQKFDLTGSLLFSVTLFCIMYGFSLLPASTGILIMGIGIIALIAFILWELRIESPIFDIRLLIRSRFFAFSTITQSIYYMAIVSIPFIMSLYLQYIRGLSPQNAGFVLLVQPILQTVFSPLTGRLSDKIQPRVIVTFGIVIVLFGIALLLTINQDTALLLIIISLILIGFGHAFVVSPNTNAIMSSVEKKYYGVASSIDVTTRAVGMTFGMSIVLFLFSLFMGTAQIKPEYYMAFLESIRVAFLVFCGFCLCCTLISATRGRIGST
jgi:EmrB/QacA subfamily drug resistance transporter